MRPRLLQVLKLRPHHRPHQLLILLNRTPDQRGSHKVQYSNKHPLNRNCESSGIGIDPPLGGTAALEEGALGRYHRAAAAAAALDAAGPTAAWHRQRVEDDQRRANEVLRMQHRQLEREQGGYSVPS